MMFSKVKICFFLGFVFVSSVSLAIAKPPAGRTTQKKTSRVMLTSAYLKIRGSLLFHKTILFFGKKAVYVGGEAFRSKPRKLFQRSKKPLSPNQKKKLKRELRKLKALIPKNKHHGLVIAADKDTPSRLISEVLKIAQEAGFSRYRFAYCFTKPSKGLCEIHTFFVVSREEQNRLYPLKRRGPKGDAPPLDIRLVVSRSGYTLVAIGKKAPKGCSLKGWTRWRGRAKFPTIARTRGKSTERVYHRLRACLRSFKEVFPDHVTIAIQPDAKTTYQELIWLIGYSKKTASQKQIYPIVSILPR